MPAPDPNTRRFLTYNILSINNCIKYIIRQHPFWASTTDPLLWFISEYWSNSMARSAKLCVTITGQKMSDIQYQCSESVISPIWYSVASYTRTRFHTSLYLCFSQLLPGEILSMRNEACSQISSLHLNTDVRRWPRVVVAWWLLLKNEKKTKKTMK